MGKDYYKLLGVDRNTTTHDLQKAFEQISQAYFVLSDPQKRAVYDQYGEEGINGQVPSQGAGSSQGRPNQNGGSPNSFRPRTADNIFTEFFGNSGPSGEMGYDIPAFSRVSLNDTGSSNIFGDIFTSSENVGRGAAGVGNSPRKAPPIVRALACSLEELYKGTTKKMKISRDVIDSSGRRQSVEEVLTLEIKAGWKTGTKITFPEKGNEEKGVIPSDLVFVIEEKPHAVFERDGNDLVITRDIALLEGVTGYNAQVRSGRRAQVTTLDDRKLTIPIENVTGSSHEQIVIGEGMPISKNPSRRGDLRIKFTS